MSDLSESLASAVNSMNAQIWPGPYEDAAYELRVRFSKLWQLADREEKPRLSQQFANAIKHEAADIKNAPDAWFIDTTAIVTERLLNTYLHTTGQQEIPRDLRACFKAEAAKLYAAADIQNYWDPSDALTDAAERLAKWAKKPSHPKP